MEWLTTITYHHYLALAMLLFTMGIIGVLLRKNLIIIFMSIELMLNAVNLVFVTFAARMGTETGQIMVIFIMTVAAAEAATGLAILVALYRNKQTIYVHDAADMKE